MTLFSISIGCYGNTELSKIECWITQKEAESVQNLFVAVNLVQAHNLG